MMCGFAFPHKMQGVRVYMSMPILYVRVCLCVFVFALKIIERFAIRIVYAFPIQTVCNLDLL